MRGNLVSLRLAVRKGLALTTETIVVIILAGVVLAALLAFFGSTFTPAKGEAKKTFDQARWCGEYARYDSNCDNYVTDFWQKLVPASTPSGTPKRDEIREGLNTACNALGFGDAIPPSPSLTPTADQIKNLRNCCNAYCRP